MGLFVHQDSSLVFMETDGTYLFHNSLSFVPSLIQCNTFHSRAHTVNISPIYARISQAVSTLLIFRTKFAMYSYRPPSM
jgi:hypothetical protein